MRLYCLDCFFFSSIQQCISGFRLSRLGRSYLKAKTHKSAPEAILYRKRQNCEIAVRDFSGCLYSYKRFPIYIRSRISSSQNGASQKLIKRERGVGNTIFST